MENNTGLVFIHGAGLNKSIWNDVQKEIPKPTLTIDFPHRKPDSETTNHLSFDDYVNTTINQIKDWGENSFMIVGHSIGACVALKVAEYYKNELKGFVAIGSVIPETGNSFTSTLPFPQKLILPLILKTFGTNAPKKLIEKELCNGLSAEQTEKVVTEFTPESRHLFTTRFHYKLPQTPRLYIKLDSDKSIPPSLQDKMMKNLKAEQTISINSGHLPMLSKPKELGTILLNFLK